MPLTPALDMSSSNFDVPLVFHMKGKIVPAKDVLAAGPQARSVMETIIVTLCHLALHSEKVELQVWLRNSLNSDCCRICIFQSNFLVFFSVGLGILMTRLKN